MKKLLEPVRNLHQTEQQRKIRTRRILSLSIILLILTGFIAAYSIPGVYQWVRQELLIPLLFRLWLGWLRLRQYNQNELWTAAFLALLVVGLYAVARRIKWGESKNMFSPQAEIPPHTHARVSFWLEQLQVLTTGRGAPEFAAREFRRMANKMQLRKQISQPMDSDRPLPDLLKAPLYASAKKVTSLSLNEIEQSIEYLEQTGYH